MTIKNLLEKIVMSPPFLWFCLLASATISLTIIYFIFIFTAEWWRY